MATVPTWLAAGVAVADLEAAAPDAPFILEGDEYDLTWVRVDVPASAFDATTPASMDEALRFCSTPAELPQCEREQARFDAVRTWMADSGGARQALGSSPLLAAVDGDRVRVLDGWHRLVVARFDYGLDAIPAVVTSDPMD